MHIWIIFWQGLEGHTQVLGEDEHQTGEVEEEWRPEEKRRGKEQEGPGKEDK